MCRIVAFRLCCLALFVGLFAAACENTSPVGKEAVRETPKATPAQPPLASAVPKAAGKTSPVSAQAKEGKALYDVYCALCHGATAEGYRADNAPSLVTQSFLESASNGFLQRAIRMGRPNTAMAAYGQQRGGPLSESDIRAIVAYLRTLGPAYKPLHAYQVKGDPKNGEMLFQAQCSKCHGDDKARGNAPSLHNGEFLSSASPAFLKHAIVNGRPPTPMQPFRGTLTDAQIDDIIAWLKGLTPPEPASPPVQRPEVPKNLPFVINPKGKAPSFQLRADRFVAAADVKKALDQKQRIIIIDARSAADWIQYHIPGSVPIGYYETERLSAVPNDGTWVVAYCACPHHASGMVVDALRKLGHKRTAILDEGILEWRKRDYPLEGEAVAPNPPSKTPTGTAKPQSLSGSSGKASTSVTPPKPKVIKILPPAPNPTP